MNDEWMNLIKYIYTGYEWMNEWFSVIINTYLTYTSFKLQQGIIVSRDDLPFKRELTRLCAWFKVRADKIKLDPYTITDTWTASDHIIVVNSKVQDVNNHHTLCCIPHLTVSEVRMKIHLLSLQWHSFRMHQNMKWWMNILVVCVIMCIDQRHRSLCWWRHGTFLGRTSIRYLYAWL